MFGKTQRDAVIECSRAHGGGPLPVRDADGDGDVDSDDLTCLLQRYGREHTDPEFDSVCDFDADGVIGLCDLATQLSVYGMPCE
jgi:hypothetical protein